MAGVSASRGHKEQPPKAVEDVLYDYLAGQVPHASERQWRAAARVLNESGCRSIGLKPALALSEARKTATKLQKIFAS
jgi:hypothetical protein